MKTPKVLNTQDVIDLCTPLGIHFVNRSYGKATTSTITLDALVKLVNNAIKNSVKESE